MDSISGRFCSRRFGCCGTGLWLVLLIYVVIAVGVENAMHYAGVSAPAGVPDPAPHIALGRHRGGTLRRFALARRGWKNVGDCQR
jgi:hypothetical protein